MKNHRELESIERIRYLEEKVSFLKQHCVRLLEQQPAEGGALDVGDLLGRLDAERERVAGLMEEIAVVRAHRDDVVRQIQHQHKHVLYLTEKIHRLEEGLLSRVLLRAPVRMVQWLSGTLRSKCD